MKEEADMLPFLFLTFMRQRMRMLLPVLTIKFYYGDMGWFGIKAINVNVNSVGVRSRCVKGFYTADFAKCVIGYPSVKTIIAKRFAAAIKRKML